jgi:hypothetical protein
VNVDVQNNVAVHLGIVGPTDWTDQQTFTYCTGFLLSGAAEYNATGPYTDYHSSLGDVVIENTGYGTCLVFFAQ